VVQAEQLQLPQAEPAGAPTGAPEESAQVAAIIARLERLTREGPETAATRRPEELRLSFSQLHQFELCPVRYRFQHVWRVPAPPDELLPRAGAAGAGAVELGVAAHRALAAWHTAGGDLLELYQGPPAGRDMLQAYLAHPLARAATLGCEVEFNLRLQEPGVGDLLLKGYVDRVCELEGETALVDYKTNARLDERLRETYGTQLRLYGLAAARGLLPGGPDPRLLLFDLREGEATEVSPDAEGAEARAAEAACRISAGDFSLRPEHRDRPCFLCAYRPICRDRR
jgi:hypothetical protein